MYVLSKEEGGRHTPFFNGYRPQFYFRTTDVTGAVTLPEGVEMVMPGDNVKMTVELITPDRHGREAALRHPRRRQDRRRRHRDRRFIAVSNGRIADDARIFQPRMQGVRQPQLPHQPRNARRQKT